MTFGEEKIVLCYVHEIYSIQHCVYSFARIIIKTELCAKAANMEYSMYRGDLFVECIYYWEYFVWNVEWMLRSSYILSTKKNNNNFFLQFSVTYTSIWVAIVLCFICKMLYNVPAHMDWYTPWVHQRLNDMIWGDIGNINWGFHKPYYNIY